MTKFDLFLTFMSFAVIAMLTLGNPTAMIVAFAAYLIGRAAGYESHATKMRKV